MAGVVGRVFIDVEQGRLLRTECTDDAGVAWAARHDLVEVLVGVFVGVLVLVAVFVGVSVGVLVGVSVGVGVLVDVFVGVGVAVGGYGLESQTSP